MIKVWTFWIGGDPEPTPWRPEHSPRIRSIRPLRGRSYEPPVGKGMTRSQLLVQLWIINYTSSGIQSSFFNKQADT